jgi:hypothetical protein
MNLDLDDRAVLAVVSPDSGATEGTAIRRSLVQQPVHVVG